MREVQMRKLRAAGGTLVSVAVVLVVIVLGMMRFAGGQAELTRRSRAIDLKAPAGDMPANRVVTVNGMSGAVLPNGRFVTPVGTELSVGAPKPYGMALSSDGNTLATVNSGIGPFSVTLFKNIKSGSPAMTLIPVSSSFMGIVFYK